jgi:hypothetical protein
VAVWLVSITGDLSANVVTTGVTVLVLVLAVVVESLPPPQAVRAMKLAVAMAV